MNSIFRNALTTWKQRFKLAPGYSNRYFAGVPCPAHGQWPIKQKIHNAPRSLNRKLAGILYADIADYSRLTEQDEEGTHYRFVESMKIMASHISTNTGQIAHLAGDAILAEFSNATTALKCAIDVQAELMQWNSSIDFNSQLQFRIGVNVGAIIIDHGDIYGSAVNVAARLEGLAQAGGICVSEEVRLNVREHLPVIFISLGEKHIKNISTPVHAYSIELALPEFLADKSSNVIRFQQASR